ncbi:MAG: hypothetical protein ACM3JD_10665, partial [Rudaea sp.]
MRFFQGGTRRRVYVAAACLMVQIALGACGQAPAPATVAPATGTPTPLAATAVPAAALPTAEPTVNRTATAANPTGELTSTPVSATPGG